MAGLFSWNSEELLPILVGLLTINAILISAFFVIGLLWVLLVFEMDPQYWAKGFGFIKNPIF